MRPSSEPSNTFSDKVDLPAFAAAIRSRICVFGNTASPSSAAVSRFGDRILLVSGPPALRSASPSTVWRGLSPSPVSLRNRKLRPSALSKLALRRSDVLLPPSELWISVTWRNLSE